VVSMARIYSSRSATLPIFLIYTPNTLNQSLTLMHIACWEIIFIYWSELSRKRKYPRNSFQIKYIPNLLTLLLHFLIKRQNPSDLITRPDNSQISSMPMQKQ
jgi:hypothetical protein